MKITWKNGGLKIRPEKQPAIFDYIEHQVAEENLANCIARQRHQLFTVRRTKNN